MLLLRNTDSSKQLEVEINGNKEVFLPRQAKIFDQGLLDDIEEVVKAFPLLSLDADSEMSFIDVQITTAEVLALNATPKVLLPALGADLVAIPLAAYGSIDFEAAAYDAGTNTLDIQYDGGSALLQLGNAFIEASADARSYVEAAEAEATPEVNTAIEATIPNADPTVGDSDIFIRLFFRTVPALLS